jgi:hypothetical protein
MPGNVTKEPDQDSATPYPVRLNPGDSVQVQIFARAEWNDTTVEVRKDETYCLEATGTWYDASISCRADGYLSRSAGFRLTERWRRCPPGNWFALIGVIGRDESTSFIIGERKEVTTAKGGVLHCYANDLPFMYGNNSGCVKLTVTRIS